MTAFRIVPRGPFDLARSQDFLAGFTPTRESASNEGGLLRLAFRADGDFAPAGVILEQGQGQVVGRVFGGAAAARVMSQAARMLSLDHDAGPFAALAGDPALAPLFEDQPGFRPVLFASPYEAAVWGILAQRIPMRVAAGVRARLSAHCGDTIDVDGVTMPLLPSPDQLIAADPLPRLPQVKWDRLIAVARAALDGMLDAEFLLGLAAEEAIGRLGRLPGVGPWTAGHILLRGCGPTDLLPLGEPRVHAAARMVYGLAETPNDDELAALAERWRPFRTWISVFITMKLFRSGKAGEVKRHRRGQRAIAGYR